MMAGSMSDAPVVTRGLIQWWAHRVGIERQIVWVWWRNEKVDDYGPCLEKYMVWK